MRRFFAGPGSVIGSETVVLGKEEAAHIAKVLRMQPGDTVVVFDGSGVDYTVRLTEITLGEVVGTILYSGRSETEPPFELTLVQGIAKGDKMDLVIQKGVEIGVSRFIPLRAARSISVPDDVKAAERVKRWNRIAMESCKQSGRSRVPSVEPVQGLSAVLASLADRPAILFFEGDRVLGLRQVLAGLKERVKNTGSLTIIIGPEGGFADHEVEAAGQAGVILAGLGPRILRTETAGMAAAAMILYELGDLG